MLKNTIILQFLVTLTLLLGLAFFAHTYLLENGGYLKYDNKIVLSYVVNGVLAASIFGTLYWFRIKLKHYIGFLFMTGIFIKFIFFFLLFYPAYKLDGDMSRLEFAAFFIPYGICLILETIYTAKMLQKLD
jgi:hypothetical protein